jgi:hypothetical protein
VADLCEDQKRWNYSQIGAYFVVTLRLCGKDKTERNRGNRRFFSID